MRYKQDASINHLIRNLKHGFAIFSRLKGTFSTQRQNLLAVILGAGVGVGVAGLYISLWDGKLISIPFISEQKDLYTVSGLQNLGNNCFLNVILQALASSTCFLSFLQNILLFDDLEIGEKDEKMPLTVALNSLLQELCIVQEQKSILNPRKVMLAMSSYDRNFNLTRQQDASEAFLHLLSALEEEISECYMLHNISLADITALPSKIYKPNMEGQNECERWKQQFVGPFDGTIGSSLTCKSCSSMLSMDFEFFRCLPLSPVLDRNAEIISGCTVVDCLNHFTAVECVENYRCGQCWHASALKYLSRKSKKDEEKVEQLEHCVNLDSCDCNKLFLQEEISWTGFSCALKQLTIGRCPRVLCIHLQRASMNEHGEFIKLQGHMSFPLLLDLFPFTQVNVGQKMLRDCVQKPEKQQPNLLVPQSRHLNMQREIHMPPHIYKIVCEKLSSETLSTKMLRKSTCEPLWHPPNETVSGDSKGYKDSERDVFASNLHEPRVEADTLCEAGLNLQIGSIDSSNPSKQCMYRLFSVVEHYGKPGGGHYAVYRRLGSENANQQWFYISDRDVSLVSEETVLAAEATLLFYEIINTNMTSNYMTKKDEQARL